MGFYLKDDIYSKSTIRRFYTLVNGNAQASRQTPRLLKFYEKWRFGDRYCLISLTLPVELCLYMGFLIAWRIVYSRALHGEL